MLLPLLALLQLLPLLALAAGPIHVPLNRPRTLEKRGAGQLLRGFGFNRYFGMDIDLGTPPQRISPILQLFHGPDQLTVIEAPTPNIDNWLHFYPGNSSTYEKGSPMSHDTMALNGISKRQEFAILPESEFYNITQGVSIMYNVKAAASLRPNSTFVAGLLEGREPQLGLFIAPYDPEDNIIISGDFYHYPTGELTIGGVNPSLVNGEPHFLPATDTWGVPLTSWSVGNESFTLEGKAGFNIGSNIGMKPAMANGTMSLVAGARLLEVGWEGRAKFWAVPCNTNVSLTFRFGDYDAVLPQSAWIMPNSSDFWSDMTEDECVSEIVSFENYPKDYPDVLLGFSFLSTVYTVLKYGDSPQIGFAPLTDTAKGVVPQLIQGDLNAVPTASIPWHSILPQPTGPADSGAMAVGASALAALLAAAAHLL